MKKIFGIILISFVFFSQAQEEKLKLFLDCPTWGCYTSYLKENLKTVEFVRDRHYADVYLMITYETTGGGGRKYVLDFQGQNRLKGIRDQWNFTVDADQQPEQIRAKLLRYVRFGLIKFLTALKGENAVAIKFNTPEQSGSQNRENKDPWNKWVFNVGVSGWGNGNSNYKSYSSNARFSAAQVKEKTKFRFSLHYSSGKSVYFYGQSKIESKKESFSSYLSGILAINDHWSYGFFGSFERSIYSNYQGAWEAKAGIEYNFFPYSESTKRMFTVSLKLGPLYNRYIERTIFNKTRELLWQSNMKAGLTIYKKWGNVRFNTVYNQFLGKPELRSLEFYASSSLRLAKGLNFRLSGSYSIIHDQVNIAAGNVDLQELLLQQKELLSSYDFMVSAGINYSFGSIYNSIVNRRFSSGGGMVFYF